MDAAAMQFQLHGCPIHAVGRRTGVMLRGRKGLLLPVRRLAVPAS
jgi:hypothetical protein